MTANSTAPIVRKFGIVLVIPILLVSGLAQAVVTASGDSLQADLVHVQTMIDGGDFAQALTAARGIVSRAKVAGDIHAQATAELRVSDALYYLGQHEATLPPLDRALALYQSINDAEGIGRAYYSMAYFYERTEPAKMVELLQRGQQYAAKIDDPRLNMNIANAMGVALWNMGRYTEAIPQFETSITIARQTHDDAALASANQNLGLIYLHRGENQAALDYFSQALHEFKQLHNTHSTAVVLGNMGNAYISLGQTEEAFHCYQRSLEIHRHNGYLRGVSIQLGNLAGIVARLDGPLAALKYQRESLAIAEKIGDTRAQINALVTLSYSENDQGDASVARQHLHKALDAARHHGDPYLRINPLFSLARIEFNSGGDSTQGWKYLDAADQAAAKIGDTYDQGFLWGLRGDQLAQENQPQTAIAAYQKAIALHRLTSTRKQVYLWLARQAGQWRKLGDNQRADEQYRASLDAIDGLDALLFTGDFRINLFKTAAEIYQEYALWLADRGLVRAAWLVLERGRARDLDFRLLQDNSGATLSPAAKTALGKLSAFQRSLREQSLSAAQRADLLAMIEQAEKDFDRTRWQNNMRPAAANADTLLPDIPPSTLAVLFSVYNDTLMVLSASEDNFQFRRRADAGSLLERCRYFSEIVSNPMSENRHLVAGRALCDALLGPELQATTTGHLILAPDKDLWSFPFAALQTSDHEYLGAAYSLSLVPSLTSVKNLTAKTKSTGSTILTIACNHFDAARLDNQSLPPLPYTVLESDRISTLGHRVKQLINPAENTLKALDFSGVQLLHIATHTLVDPLHPNRASIVLAPGGSDDGFLQAREIYQLPLNARLTMVTGCRSGDGGAVPGEGLLGLSHAFMSAGSRSVVLSRWNVSDAGAAFFSNQFQRALVGDDVETALTAARQACLASDRWNHPAWWAGYFVAGDGQQTLDLPRRVPRHLKLLLGGVEILAGLFALGIYLWFYPAPITEPSQRA